MFNVSIMAKKGAGALVGFVIAYLTSHGLLTTLQSWGIQIDPAQLTLTLGAIFAGLFESLRNYLKNKVGIKWL